ncbi:hypothetical protein [Trichlorobacter lovleyi]
MTTRKIDLQKVYMEKVKPLLNLAEQKTMEIVLEKVCHEARQS